MKADPVTESAVMGILNMYAIAYGKKDIENVISLFAPDPDMVTIGVGQDDRRIGLTEFKDRLEAEVTRFEKAKMDFTWHSVSCSGNVAWIAADIIMHEYYGSKEVNYPVRLTAVMEHRKERWLITQLHKSLPATG
ncbi:MAG: nuclear transport factor 2 family protein [Candidatus Eremiobacteraeota bacterium]|nr:nuclear transport factor 2 family protein [Candidatus Eremiobacteraeota bacterium]